MNQVEQLRADWERENAAKKAAAEKRKAKSGQAAPDVEEESGLFDDQLPANDNAPFFEDSDDEDEGDANENSKGVVSESAPTKEGNEIANDVGEAAAGEVAQETTEKELFGGDSSSSDESDDELIPSGIKRANESQPDEAGAAKKRRVMEDNDE